MNALICVALLVPTFENPSLEIRVRLMDVEAASAGLKAEHGDTDSRVVLVDRRLKWLRAARANANELRDKSFETLRRIVVRRVRGVQSEIADLKPDDAKVKPLQARLRVYKRWAADVGATEESLTIPDLVLRRALLTGRLRYAQATRGPKDASVASLAARLTRAEKAIDQRRPLLGVAKVKSFALLIGAARDLKRDLGEAKNDQEKAEIELVIDTLLIIALDP